MGLITRNGYIINKPEEYLRKKALYKKLLEEEKIEKKKLGEKKKLTSKVKNPYKENEEVTRTGVKKITNKVDQV